MDHRTHFRTFSIRRVADVPEAWLGSLIDAVESNQKPGASTHFVMDLPESLWRANSRRAFVKVFTRRPKHSIMRRLKSSRALDEFRACVAFSKASIPVHEPVCCGEHRIGGLLERAFVVTRFVDDATDCEALFRRGQSDVLDKVVELLGRIHATGRCHGDARLSNFLLVNGAGVCVDVCQSRSTLKNDDLEVLCGTALAAGATRGQVERAYGRYEGARIGDATSGQPARPDQRTWARILQEAERESQRKYGYKIIGAEGAHNALRAVLAAAKPGKILDAPAGEGILSQFLHLREWEVHCADIDPGNFRLPHLALTTVDLNRPLPFPDAAFDAVVCANALHRLYNPAGCIAELARVLRPGGRLYVNVNNYASIDKRLRFLVYGSIDNQVNSSLAQQSTDVPEANLRIALHMPMICNALERAGLVIETVKPSAIRPVQLMLSPLAAVFAALGLLVGPRSRKRNRLRYANGWGVLPGGKYLLAVARKPG